MNFFKSLFGGSNQTPEEKKQNEAKKQFDAFKYDGVRALKVGQVAIAVQCFTQALELQDDLECHEYLSRAYIHAGQLPEAYQELLILTQAEPENVDLLAQMASVCYMMEDYVAMAEACEKSLLVDNANPLTYYLYAQACHAQADETNAVAMLTKAIQLKDDYGSAYLLRGDILRLTGNLDEAHQDVDWLLSHEAENEEVLLLAAHISHAQGEKQTALTYYDKVIDVNPFSIEALQERSALRRDLGDEAGAEADEALANELQEQNNSQQKS